jgi:hypothetical protein
LRSGDREGTWSEPERLAEQGPYFPVTNRTFVPPRAVSHSDGRAVGIWLLTANPDDNSGLFNTLWSSDYR